MERSATQESPASAEGISGHSDPGFRFAASGLRLLHRFVGPQLLGLELRKAASKHDLLGNALLLSVFLVVHGHHTMPRWKVILRKEDAEVVEGLDEINEELWWRL